MGSTDGRTAQRWIWIIAGVAFLQAGLTAVTVIPVYLAWHSVPRALGLLGYALTVGALGFGLLRWRRPVFPIVLALLVAAALGDQMRRGVYVGLIPGALYLIAYALGIVVTRQAGRSTRTAPA